MNRLTARSAMLALAVLGAGALLVLLVTGVTASPPPAETPRFDANSRAASTTPVIALTPITLPTPCWRIPIAADGLYRLSYEALEAAGVPTSTPPAAYHLLWRGQEVAMQEVGTGDSTFDPGDALLFYGQKFHGSVQDEKYTDENVYWLFVDAGTPGLRMATRSAAPPFRTYLPLVLEESSDGGGGSAAEPAWYTATARAEENLVYWARWSTAPGTDTTWFWDQITTDAIPVTHTYPITLTAPVAASYNASMLIEVAAKTHDILTSPDHHLRLSVNGTTIGEVTWDGKTGAVFSLSVPSAALISGTNQVQVTVLADLFDLQDIYVDRIEIAYRRAYVAEGDRLSWTTPASGAASTDVTGFSTAAIDLYDISYPLTPTRLVSSTIVPEGTTYTLRMYDGAPAGTAYLAAAESTVADAPTISIYYPPSDLISPTTGADEIIITHADFITALQPLADHRRSQGLRVRVVDAADVYALFNGGVFHPEAIRSFVAHAYTYWPGRPPAYLLLVGDGNFNFKGYNPTTYGSFVPTMIPPYLMFADSDQGEVPVDSRYGDMDLTWDGLPEVAVGRIPANSATQVEGAVAKILAYESAVPGPWMDRVILVADDGDGKQEGFSQVLDNLAGGYLPTGVETRTVYIEDYCAIAPETPCLSATLALTQTWSDGGLLLTYAGHGAVFRWAHEPLLLNTQLASLTGTEGLPFVISLDCWDGYWMFPPKYPGWGFAGQNLQSTGEWATTVLTDRGAIALFGPAGLGYVYEENLLAQRMYQAMFQEGNFQLGPLTQVGREAVYWTYLARTYTLLGDPALYLPGWDHITLTPTALTVTVGTRLELATTFAATGTTRFGQDFPVTPTWTAGAGTIDGWGYYTAPVAATTTVLTAHLGSVAATVTVNVVTGGTTADLVGSIGPPPATTCGGSCPRTLVGENRTGSPQAPLRMDSTGDEPTLGLNAAARASRLDLTPQPATLAAMLGWDTLDDKNGPVEIAPLKMTGWRDSRLGRNPFVSATSHTEGVPGGCGACPERSRRGQEPPTNTPGNRKATFEAG